MTDPIAPGTPVVQQYRKFDGSPHWRFETTYLGSDEFGRWVGGRPGALCQRPGFQFVADAHWVTLIPEEEWFVATVNDVGGALRSQIYIDLMSVPQWQGTEVHAIDLDLDVIRRFTGEAYIDDEDEFADHQARFGYPRDLIDIVRRTADELLIKVQNHREPFGQVGLEWLAVCRGDEPQSAGITAL